MSPRDSIVKKVGVTSMSSLGNGGKTDTGLARTHRHEHLEGLVQGDLHSGICRTWPRKHRSRAHAWTGSCCEPDPRLTVRSEHVPRAPAGGDSGGDVTIQTLMGAFLCPRHHKPYVQCPQCQQGESGDTHWGSGPAWVRVTVGKKGKASSRRRWHFSHVQRDGSVDTVGEPSHGGDS